MSRVWFKCAVANGHSEQLSLGCRVERRARAPAINVGLSKINFVCRQSSRPPARHHQRAYDESPDRPHTSLFKLRLSIGFGEQASKMNYIGPIGPSHEIGTIAIVVLNAKATQEKL
jgi:hypothetical protein